MWHKGEPLSPLENRRRSWLIVGGASGRSISIGGEVEIRPSDTRASLHDIQAIQILRLVSSFDLWISRRGPGFHITRCQLDRHHEDEDRELCVEVRVFFFFSLFLLMG